MKLNDPRITILINQDYTEIELQERQSNSTFCRIRLTPQQLSSALSRLGYVECESEVYNLDHLGKTHENIKFEFEIPNKDIRPSNEELIKICLKALKDKGMQDWKPDTYFNGQDSFFTKNGKRYAQTAIRRWV